MQTRNAFAALRSNARILFIRLRSMGDCLLLTAPLRALKEEFPGFHTSVLVESRFADCFKANPDIAEVISIRRKTEALHFLVRSFDLIVNLHGGPTSLTYAWMARGPRLGLQGFQYSWAYSGLLPPPEPGIHSVEATMAAFRWMGVQRSTPPLRYEAVSGKAQQMVGLIDKPYAVLHPAASASTKQWEPDRFGHLGRALQDRGLSIAVTCGPGEESLAERVARDVPSSKIFPAPPIPELAELLRGARLYVGNDSGPMHLAAAVKTPVVVLWGSSDATRWHPWKTKYAVVQNPFECNPCPGYRCLVAPTPLCIESVTVEQALAAAERILRES